VKRKPGHAGILGSFGADDAGASRALLRQKGSGRQSSLVTAADRETAGVVLFAKRPATCAGYHALFGEREVAKTYQAIAPGNALRHFPLTRASNLVTSDDMQAKFAPSDANIGDKVWHIHISWGGCRA
jgi:23S rRNA-/tRNA-specific pseudouridylate synthase